MPRVFSRESYCPTAKKRTFLQLWHGLLTVPLALTEGLQCIARPSVDPCGRVRRPCHNWLPRVFSRESYCPTAKKGTVPLRKGDCPLFRLVRRSSSIARFLATGVTRWPSCIGGRTMAGC